MNRLLHSALLGSAPGAAGTTALNAVTYLDMAVRGRPASSTPEDTVDRLSETLHVPVPGSDEVQRHRVAGLGPLTGLGIGTLLGACRAAARGRDDSRHGRCTRRDERTDDRAGGHRPAGHGRRRPGSPT